MKTIGLIGGMSWESTATYYRIINETVKERLGGLHSAKIILYSLDFADIEKHLKKDEWDECTRILINAAAVLENAGADFIVICTNTMHKAVPIIQKQINIPILHIAEVTADRIMNNGLRKIALLGTKHTMQQDFYKQKLTDKGLIVMIPDSESIEFINHVIFDELCIGDIVSQSRAHIAKIMDDLKQQGAEAVIFGCTELGLLFQMQDEGKTLLPVFDTTIIHAESAAYFALEKDV